MPDSNTVVWCGLAARGAAWCDVGGGRRAAAGVHGRASGMRVCNSASGSARRAGVRPYFYFYFYCYYYYHYLIYNYVERFMRLLDDGGVP